MSERQLENWTPATRSDIDDYVRGVETGVMESATVNSMARVLRRCRILESEVETQHEILDKLPKCWRLVAGKLVQDWLVVPGMRVHYPNCLGGIALATAYEVTADEVLCVLPDACVIRVEAKYIANSPEAAEALAQRSDDANTPTAS